VLEAMLNVLKSKDDGEYATCAVGHVPCVVVGVLEAMRRVLLCMPEAMDDVLCLPGSVSCFCTLEVVNSVLEMMRYMLLYTLEAVEACAMCWSCWRSWRVCSVH